MVFTGLIVFISIRAPLIGWVSLSIFHNNPLEFFFYQCKWKSGYRSAPSHHFIPNLHDFVTCFVFLTNTHVNMFVSSPGLPTFACLPALKMTTVLREHVKLLRRWKFQYFFRCQFTSTVLQTWLRNAVIVEREVIHDGQIPSQTLSCLGRMCSLRTVIRLSWCFFFCVLPSPLGSLYLYSFLCS